MKAFFAILILAAGLGFGGAAHADYQDGMDAYVRGDYATALKEWRPLIEWGNAAAQHNLGYMYEAGEGLPQDYKEAVKWYRKAAERGYASAQMQIGSLYEDGRGVLQDYKKAVKWFRKAAEQGDALAQFSLGRIYANGEGTLQDNWLEHMWFNIGASNEDKFAVKNRDIIAKRMTASEIGKAQDMARRCIESDYKAC